MYQVGIQIVTQHVEFMADAYLAQYSMLATAHRLLIKVRATLSVLVLTRFAGELQRWKQDL